MQQVWPIFKELKTILEVCSGMCFNKNLRTYFHHTKNKHVQMLMFFSQRKVISTQFFPSQKKIWINFLQHQTLLLLLDNLLNLHQGNLLLEVPLELYMTVCVHWNNHLFAKPLLALFNEMIFSSIFFWWWAVLNTKLGKLFFYNFSGSIWTMWPSDNNPYIE